MAHELAYTEQEVVMMAYQGETPWHGLGNALPTNADVTMAMEAAHLDYQVSTAPMFTDDGKVIPRYRVVRREESATSRPVIGVVTEGFQVIQNKEAFMPMQEACEKYGIVIETAGAIYNGARAWMQAKMPLTLEPVPGDKVDGYFLVMNGHDGKMANIGRATPQRVVCKNTLEMALGNGRNIYSIWHTANASKRVAQATQMVDQLFTQMLHGGEALKRLAERQMRPYEVTNYLNAILPPIFNRDGIESPTLIARRQMIRSLVYFGKGAAMAGSDPNTGITTAWGAYNGVTEYVDHVRPVEKGANQRRANMSAAFGQSQLLKARAYNVAVELTA